MAPSKFPRAEAFLLGFDFAATGLVPPRPCSESFPAYFWEGYVYGVWR